MLPDWLTGAVGLFSSGALSNVPWVTALLSDRLVTRGAFLRAQAISDKAVSDLKEAHDAELVALREAHGKLVAETADHHAAQVATLRAEIARLADDARAASASASEERDYERARANTQEARAEAWMGKVNDLTREFGATSLAILRALPAAPAVPHVEP